MSALSVSLVLVAVGVLLVCSAIASRIVFETVSSLRGRSRSRAQADDGTGGFSQRLDDLREMRFGRPMLPPGAVPPRVVPRALKSQRAAVTAVSSASKRDKDKA